MFQACGWSNMFQCQMKQIPSVVFLGNIEKCFRISGNISEQLFCRLSLIDYFWIHNAPKLYRCFNKLFAISCKLLNQTSILTAAFLIATSQFDLLFHRTNWYDNSFFWSIWIGSLLLEWLANSITWNMESTPMNYWENNLTANHNSHLVPFFKLSYISKINP